MSTDEAHREEWAVRSQDGQVYEVEGRTEVAARRELALLRTPDADGYSEPHAMLVHRQICGWHGVRLIAAPVLPVVDPT